MAEPLRSRIAEESSACEAVSIKKRCMRRWSMLPRVERVELMQSCFTRWLELHFESRTYQDRLFPSQKGRKMDLDENFHSNSPEHSHDDVKTENLRLKERNKELEAYLTEMSENLYVVEDEVKILRDTLKKYVGFLNALDQSQYDIILSESNFGDRSIDAKKNDESTLRMTYITSRHIHGIDVSQVTKIEQTLEDLHVDHSQLHPTAQKSLSRKALESRKQTLQGVTMSPILLSKERADENREREVLGLIAQIQEELSTDSSSRASGHMTATRSSAGTANKSLSMVDPDSLSELSHSDCDDSFKDPSPGLWSLKEMDLIAEKCEQLRIAQESIEALQAKIARSELGRADLHRRLEHAKSELQIERERNRSLERIFG